MIGNEKVKKNKLGVTTPWIIEKYMRTGINCNWSQEQITVNEREVQRTGNVICAQIIFTVKRRRMEVVSLKTIVI